MPSVRINCPHCKADTAVTPATLFIRPDGVPAYERYWWLGACNNRECARPVLVAELEGKLFKTLPSPSAAPVSEDVPDPMRADVNEARECFAVKAYNASVVMARRALQQALRSLGIEDNLLVNQINRAFQERHINIDQRDYAHGVRWVGNLGAHGEGTEEPRGVTEDEAKTVLELVDTLFQAFYVARAGVERLARNRQ